MISAFEQYFTALKGKKIAVLGLGVSNRPLVRLLLEFGCDVTGCDMTPREKLDAEVLELEPCYKGKFGDKFAGQGIKVPTLEQALQLAAERPALHGVSGAGADAGGRFPSAAAELYPGAGCDPTGCQ